MMRATTLATGGDSNGQVTLSFDDRHRRRLALETDDGEPFLLDLPEATVLRDGDLLRLEDGRLIAVRAADEPVADLFARDGHHLLRLAWHLGNRHLPTQIMQDRLRIRQDHVIEEMAEGLGARVERRNAPFDPEGGAYGHGVTHGHDHGHDHGHSHG